MSHFRRECKHGQVIAQCRCPGPRMAEVVDPCPFPEHTTSPDRAAAPDPRFRDKLASALAEYAGYTPGSGLAHTWFLPAADALLPLIAAEVEARVQAAADQRAAEERQHLTTVLADLLRLTYDVQLDSGTWAARKESERVADVFRARIADHCRERDARVRRARAALAQPAPATDEEGRA